MGRAASGMEDDGPIADARKMPSFIGTFEEGGRAKLSRSLPPTESSRTDGGKVGDPDPALPAGGAETEPEERSNNNNNCNGGGGVGVGGGDSKRRASAVEILIRNLGVSRSPSLRRHSARRMQCESREADAESECSDGEKSEREAGDAVTENEPTSSQLTSSDGRAVERLTATGRSGANTAPPSESFRRKEHVYCTVYCIANDGHRKDAEISDNDAVAAEPGSETGRGPDPELYTSPQMDAEAGQDAGSSPGPVLYTLDDLVDPFGDMARWSSSGRAGAETTMHCCRVCLESKSIAPLSCCGKAVCDECMKLYVTSQVRIAKPYIHCLIPECSSYLEEALVVSHLASEDVAKYHYFLELSQLDSSTKPCPQCSLFTSLREHSPSRSEHKYKIQCSSCQFVWCFKCHAPWHNGIKCRDYRRGDKLLRSWASVIEHGQRNAQKCPQCKIHIQRTEGCDHMTCTQCNTNFCYRCGERYRHLRFFGDHTSNLSVFGCKFRYLPDKPHLRRLVRGSVCATKVLIAPVVILLVMVLGALALVIGLVVFPVYYVCKRRKKQQRTQGSGRWI